jgi:nucleotide-binding universal stress UspA family protein
MEITEAALQVDRPAPVEGRPGVEEPTYRRAVIPLDGSVVAEAIIPVFMKIARPLRLELVLLRVVQPLSAQAMAAPSRAAENIERSRHEAEEYLATVAGDLRARNMPIETSVRLGDPATEIVSGAAELGADLIAMTTHGRSGLGRLFFGSVAEAVLRHARVPVFLLRVSEEESARHAA